MSVAITESLDRSATRHKRRGAARLDLAVRLWKAP